MFPIALLVKPMQPFHLDELRAAFADIVSKFGQEAPCTWDTVLARIGLTPEQGVDKAGESILTVKQGWKIADVEALKTVAEDLEDFADFKERLLHLEEGLEQTGRAGLATRLRVDELQSSVDALEGSMVNGVEKLQSSIDALESSVAATGAILENTGWSGDVASQGGATALPQKEAVFQGTTTPITG